MFELAGHLGLPEEARPDSRIPGVLGAELLQRHVAAQAIVAGEPDATHAAGGVKSGQCVSFAVSGDMVGGGEQDVAQRGWGETDDGLADAGSETPSRD